MASPEPLKRFTDCERPVCATLLDRSQGSYDCFPPLLLKRRAVQDIASAPPESQTSLDIAVDEEPRDWCACR